MTIKFQRWNNGKPFQTSLSPSAPWILLQIQNSRNFLYSCVSELEEFDKNFGADFTVEDVLNVTPMLVFSPRTVASSQLFFLSGAVAHERDHLLEEVNGLDDVHQCQPEDLRSHVRLKNGKFYPHFGGRSFRPLGPLISPLS